MSVTKYFIIKYGHPQFQKLRPQPEVFVKEKKFREGSREKCRLQ